MTRHITRRNYLTATIAAVAATGTAGCLGTARDQVERIENRVTGSAGIDPNNVTGTVHEIPAYPDNGYHWTYYLYIPDNTHSHGDGEPPLLVNPTAIPSSQLDRDEERQHAHGNISSGPVRHIADELSVPVISPAFPRPGNDDDHPVDWRYGIGNIDRETLTLTHDDAPRLARPDKQTVHMIRDARDRLETHGHPVTTDGVLMYGFSGAARFTDHFTVLHPDEVLAAAAGGNSMMLLPAEEWNGHELKYHVGIADLNELIGRDADVDALNDTRQFYFFGGEDTNPILSHRDVYVGEINELAQAVYDDGPYLEDDGEEPSTEVVQERFETSEAVYDAVGIDNTEFELYPETKHTAEPAIPDVIEFLDETVAQYR